MKRGTRTPQEEGPAPHEQVPAEPQPDGKEHETPSLTVGDGAGSTNSTSNPWSASLVRSETTPDGSSSEVRFDRRSNGSNTVNTAPRPSPSLCAVMVPL